MFARQNFVVLSLSAALALSACGLFSASSGLMVESTDRQKLVTELVGREYVLASSMFKNRFFGESDRLFVDARPADILELYHHGGEQVPVAPFESEILYAGTPVRVKDVIYPPERVDEKMMDSRGELQPTGHTWIVLERTDGDNKPLVLVLPKDIPTVEAFRAAFTARLASAQWVTSWLAQRESTILDSIYKKEAVQGMSEAEVVAALGQPKNARQAQDEGSLEYVADYGDVQVTYSGSKAVKVISMRAEAAVARQKAAEEADKARAEAEKRRAEEEVARKKAEEEEKVAQAERDRQEELERKKQETADSLAKKKAEEEAERDHKLALKKQDEEARRAELEARKTAAERDKEEAQRDKERKLEEARLAKETAAAEADAARAQRDAELAALKANKEVEEARKKADAELKKIEVERAAVEKRHAAALKAQQAEVDKARAAVEAAVNKSESEVEKARAEVAAASEPKAAKSGELPPGRSLDLKLKSVNAQTAKDAGLDSPRGAFVREAKAEGAGYAAGLRDNDIILSFNGQDVTEAKDLVGLAAIAPKDRKVYIEVWRDGKAKVLTMDAMGGAVDEVALGKAKEKLAKAEAARDAARDKHAEKVVSAEKKLADLEKKRDGDLAPLEARNSAAKDRLREVEDRATSAPETSAAPSRAPASTASNTASAAATGKSGRKLGLKLRGPETAELKKAGSTGGSVVTKVESDGAGALAGFEENDLIVTFDGEKVADTKHLAQLAKGAASDRKIYVEVFRAGKTTTLVLAPEGAASAAAPAASPAKTSYEKKPEAKVEDDLAEQNKKRQDNKHLIPQRRTEPTQAGEASDPEGKSGADESPFG